MRQPPEFFEDQDLELVYIAKTLDEALNVEELLSGGGLDYLVEADKYKGGVIFASERVGAFFYTVPADVSKARGILTSAGYRAYTMEE